MARISRIFASCRTAATQRGRQALGTDSAAGRGVRALRLAPLLVSVHLACALDVSQGAEGAATGTEGASGLDDTSATESTTGATETTEPGMMTEGCGDWGATEPVFSYGQGSIVEPSDPDTDLWTAPRQACELATIVDLDVAPESATYVLSTAFLHKDTCSGACPWRYWLRRLSAAAEEEWAAALDFPAYEPHAVRALDGGGAAVGGAASVGAERFPWLARYDESGALIWEETFAEPGQITAIARGPENVVVAIGELRDGMNEELLAVQRTADGAAGWTFTLEDDRDDAGFGVAVDAEGRTWIVGGRDPGLSESLSYYSPDNEYAWWYVFPESFQREFSVADPFVALVDTEGALVWLHELAPPPGASRSSGLGIDLLPGGDAIVGVSWRDTPQQQFARYAADGTEVWTTLVPLEGDYAEDIDLDELACGADGRTHALLEGQIIQLDDAGEVLETLTPHTEGAELALTPSNALWTTRWRSMGDFNDTWHLDPR